MRATTDELLKVYPVDGHSFVHAPAGRGEELRLHLAAHGVASRVSPLAEAKFDRLELEAGADPVAVQAILDHWER
jgi:hypothetical protein